jgi:hypothetical protein
VSFDLPEYCISSSPVGNVFSFEGKPFGLPCDSPPEPLERLGNQKFLDWSLSCVEVPMVVLKSEVKWDIELAKGDPRIIRCR